MMDTMHPNVSVLMELDLQNLDGSSLEFDAVVVWRIIDSKIAEAWYIPAVNTIRTVQRSEGA